ATLSGIQAVRAAQRGYTAEERILEMRLGFFESYGGVDGAEAGAKATRDLGQSWDIVTDMAVKLVPGGHPYHALAEAAANAARDGDDPHHRWPRGHEHGLCSKGRRHARHRVV